MVRQAGRRSHIIELFGDERKVHPMMPSLRSLIEENSPLIVPSIYDGISALLVKEIGFDAAYIGSYATGAAKYGVPDIGYIGLEDMADQVRRLGSIVEVPIIVDGEDGWGNPMHVARAVKTLERAGAAAMHIEDHDFGKHLADKPRILPTSVAVDKIKAALDARDSEEFLIIARTDAPGSEGSEASVDRALAYAEAGADGVFVAGVLDVSALARLNSEVSVPIYSVDWPDHSAADHAREGADVVLYYGLSHVSAKAGMKRALQLLKNESSTTSIAQELNIWGFDAFLGIEEYRIEARKYGLID
ncbi:isocitrate lyase/PEP mutase family protein [Streptomyces sp. NPDC002143]